MAVKSNFTSDLIFLIHEDSEKIGFHFFFVQNLNGSLVKMTNNADLLWFPCGSL